MRGVPAIVGCLLATVVSCSVLVGVAGATTVGTPTISPTGTPREGQTLTVNNAAATPATATITDQWLVCKPACPTSGPTGSTLLLTAADVGATIEVLETANDTSVTATAPNPVTAMSTATAAVAPLSPPVNTALPTIAGTAQLGQVLTLTQGVWTNSPTIRNQWEDCTGASCTPIAGATGLTYTVAVGDIGHTIDVLESASNDGTITPVTARSAQTGVAVAPPVNTVLPAISGTPQQGQVLTVTPGTWLNTPTSITEQWEDCVLACTAIPGQNGTTYTVGPGDVGHTIEVVETASNAAAPLPTGVAATSGRTGIASTTSTTSVVAFSQNAPTTNQAITLVATVSSASANANPRGSLSFFNGSDAIRGCAGKGVAGGQTITIVCQAAFPAGVAQISAAYVADPASLVAGSSSDTTPVNVGRGTTAVSLAVTPKVAPGGHATYVATLVVPVSDAGPTLPSGSVEFLDGGQPIGGCANQALSSLTATCSVSYAAAGSHAISALYNGDSNFTGSTSPPSNVQIVAGAAKAPTVRGSLGSTLGWKIAYHPHYSELIALEAYAIPKGTTILVQCSGKSCPFATWHRTKVAGTINLLSPFRHHRLRAGTRITVRFTRRHWVGKYYSFTIRAGHAPVVRTDCLAPGAPRPGVGCASTST
ncbi:MAG: Ig-like domain repeat protein [Solirubrobacteraceae bacterium]